jgi:adenosylcobyric acid synthase
MYRDIRIPEEDAVPVEKIGGGLADGRIRIDVVLHPRMSNFTDFDALEAEPDVAPAATSSVRTTACPTRLILPGTKSTIADLRRLKEAGFAAYVSALPGERGHGRGDLRRASRCWAR